MKKEVADKPNFILVHRYVEMKKWEKIGGGFYSRWIDYVVYSDNETEDVYVNVAQIASFTTHSITLIDGKTIDHLTETAAQIRGKIMRAEKKGNEQGKETNK